MSIPQAGQTIAVRVKAATAAREVVREGTVVAEFWAPGRDPEHTPEQRESPDHSVECEFDARSRGWVAQVTTEGWAPGQWTVRGRVAGQTGQGVARGWAWNQFSLAA